jgi:hypothetical protein
MIQVFHNSKAVLSSVASGRNMSKPLALVVAAAVGSVVASASAQIDNLSVLVNTSNSTGGNSLASVAYDPASDTAYVSSFGAGGALRRITGVSTVSPVSSVVVSEAQLQLYYRDGDVTRSVLTPLQSGLIFNPAPVGPNGEIPTAGALWIADNGATRFPGGSTQTDPNATKRFYRYNLNDIPPGGDGRDVFTTLLTLADQQAAAGVASNINDNIGRKPAFSTDGKWLYATDSGSTTGGIYRIDPFNPGGTTRIINISGGTGNTSAITEPAVLKNGNFDRIFLRGTGVTSTGGDNIGGVNYVDHDPVANTTSPLTPLVTAQQFRDFLERPATFNADVRSIAADAAGNLYFMDLESLNLIKRDTQGRLIQITNRTERRLAYTGTLTGANPNSVMSRMAAVPYNHPTAGAITRIVYAESTPLNFFGAVDIFKPSDFNRDGLENQSDRDLFKAKLTPRGILSSLDDSRFDLNGNQVIDYADVKILQSFVAFPDGDANLDLTVGFSDLLEIARNYNRTGDATWVMGDFTGDDAVDFNDLLVLARNYGATAPGVDVTGIGSPDFQADWALALSIIPEPTTLGLLAGTLLLAQRRRRE